MHPLAWTIVVVSGIVAVPSAVFALEIVAGVLARGRRRGGDAGEARARACVVVPAHDEAGIVRATVEHLRGVIGEGDEVLVVADNCTDATADEARAGGARVVERTDPGRRGKGYALAHGVAHAGDARCIVVIDADCRTDRDSFEAIVRGALRTGRPVQAVYEMRPPEGTSVRDRVSAFAFSVRNRARACGLQAIAGACQLTGSGMAFPRALVEGDALASGDIVEDMRLGLKFAAMRRAPMLFREAAVWSVLPGQSGARTSQRTRWEHGHLATIARCVPGAVARGTARANPRLIAMGIDLAVPPVSLLVLIAGVCALAGVGVGVFVGGWMAIIAGCVPAALIGVGTAIAWWWVGRDVLPARMAPGVAWYAIAKVPMYARALVSRERAWVRTPRDG